MSLLNQVTPFDCGYWATIFINIASSCNIL